jgi:hypothetical protein
MTSTEANDALLRPIISDRDIEDRVAGLLRSAIRRQWWTLYLDADDVQRPVLMPMAGYPERPDEQCDGRGTVAQIMAARLAEIVGEIGAAKLVFVWERPGGAETTVLDRSWAAGLGEACRAEGLAVRAQLILHAGGVRWFAPDDYA